MPAEELRPEYFCHLGSFLALLRLFKRKLDLLKILIFNIKQTYYELLNANGALFKSNNHQMLSMDMQILKE